MSEVAVALVVLSSGSYFIDSWNKHKKITRENNNPTFLLKFGKIVYLQGHSRCKELQMPKSSKERRLSKSQGREVNDEREHPCQKLLDWVSAALFSTKKQIVGSNLGLPATQTHKRMWGSIPWTHTIKCSQQLCSYSLWKVQRKTNEQV